MGFVKWLLWTGCAVGLGIFLASGDIDGRTPLEHLQRAWKRNVHPSQVDRVKDGLEDAWEDAKERVSGNGQKAPREHISEEDREAVNRIIAKKK